MRRLRRWRHSRPGQPRAEQLSGTVGHPVGRVKPLRDARQGNRRTGLSTCDSLGCRSGARLRNQEGWVRQHRRQSARWPELQHQLRRSRPDTRRNYSQASSDTRNGNRPHLRQLRREHGSPAPLPCDGVRRSFGRDHRPGVYRHEDSRPSRSTCYFPHRPENDRIAEEPSARRQPWLPHCRRMVHRSRLVDHLRIVFIP